MKNWGTAATEQAMQQDTKNWEKVPPKSWNIVSNREFPANNKSEVAANPYDAKYTMRFLKSEVWNDAKYKVAANA